MEQVYWLSRERASLKPAQDAVNFESRLIHHDLTGRYGVKARSADGHATALGGSLSRAIYADAADDHIKEPCHA
jgi:hypothetical protein